MMLPKKTISLIVICISILFIKPSIVFFILSLFKVLLALAIAVPISLIIVSQTISYAVKVSSSITEHRRQQNNDENDVTMIKQLRHKMYLMYENFILKLAQSAFVETTTQEKVHMDTLLQEDEFFSLLSDVNIGTSNFDKLVMQIFEYTYRDFVETWYKEVSNDNGKLHKLLMADFLKIFENLRDRLSKVDKVNLIMDKIVKILCRHFEEVRMASRTRLMDYLLILTLPIDDIKNSSMRVILREVLSGLVVLPSINTICDPDYINQTLVQYADTKDEVNEARTYMYAATYEKFVSFINECKDVSVLQKIRYQIMMEIMHATNISSLKKEGIKTSGKGRQMAKGDLLISRDLKRYINQCQIAKEHCERRIKMLGGDEYGSRFKSTGTKRLSDSHMQLLTFEEVMLCAMNRSYFLRYLKTIGKSSLLKYYNEVEIIRMTKASGRALAQMVSHAYKTYITQGGAEQLDLSIDRSVIKGMEACVVGEKEPTDFYTVQKQIYKLLETDFYPSFVVSDVYVYQLMPELINSEQPMSTELDEHNAPVLENTKAFGQARSDNLLQKLRDIESKLEYKAQALETLKPSRNVDSKVTQQLESDIASLQAEKLRLQVHIERTEFWWSKIGQWSAIIAHADLEEVTEGCYEPVYTIIVKCTENNEMYDVTDDVSGWMIGRTLSEFRIFHKLLKSVQPWVKTLTIPKTSFFGLTKISDKFMKDSQQMLSDYLAAILKDDVLGCSEIVYDFFCKKNEIETDKKNEDTKWQIGNLLKMFPLEFTRPSEEENALDTIDLDDRKDSIASPLYELTSEIFELRGVFKPLRQTLIVFVRLVFGGSINKQIHDTVDWLVSEPMLCDYLQYFINAMWPDGKLANKAESRTEEILETGDTNANRRLQRCKKAFTKMKHATVMKARGKVLNNIPEIIQSLVGQENSRRGCVKVFNALQNKKLNKHLAYTMLGAIFEDVFPEIVQKTK